MSGTLILMTVSNTIELTGSEQEIARVDEYLAKTFRDNSECLFEFSFEGENFRIPIAQYTGHRCTAMRTGKKLVHGNSRTQEEPISYRKQQSNDVGRVISEEKNESKCFLLR